MGQVNVKKAAGSHNSLTMRSIFNFLTKQGYHPTYESTYILFELDENSAVVEYEDGILSIRLFFTIDEEAYGLFLEASNAAMMESFIVKPTVLDDMKSIMVSCEMMCDTPGEFKKFFPRGVELLNESLYMHKEEIKKLIASGKDLAVQSPDEQYAALPERRKLVS